MNAPHKAIVFLAEILAYLACYAPTEAPDRKLGTDQPPREVGSLEGVYAVQGQEMGENRKYAGVAVIRKHGDCYMVDWNSGAITKGVGHRLGDTFTVGWISEGFTGMTTFKTTLGKDGPVLVGFWVSRPGNGQKHKETLTYIAPLPRVEEE